MFVDASADPNISPTDVNMEPLTGSALQTVFKRSATESQFDVLVANFSAYLLAFKNALQSLT